MSDAGILNLAAKLKDQGTAFALVTVVRAVSPTSAKPGAKAIVQADGVVQGWIGGGCAQPAVIKSAKQALEDGEPRLIRISPTKNQPAEEGVVDFGMTCHSGGALDIFIDPVLPLPLLLILGDSPTAVALAGLAPRVGLDVNVACRGVQRAAFPDATTLHDGFDLGALTGGRKVFAVVATQGKRDEAALEAALSTGTDYVAFIASQRKAARLREYLTDRGHDADRVGAIRAPAGVEIGAATPEEIALSVLAEVVKARRTEAATATSLIAPATTRASASGCCSGARTGTVMDRAEAIDPVCGMSVRTDDCEIHYASEGTTYYFCCESCRQAFSKTPFDYVSERAGA